VRPGLRLFLLKPTTGKTHQIRVALKSEGAPILGDKMYSSSSADRTYLHAYSLTFKVNNKPYKYTCMPDCGEHFDLQCCARIQAMYEQPEILNWPNI